MKKILVLTISTLLYSSFSMAGGGGGGTSFPNHLLSVCTIKNVNHAPNLPTGKHISFREALGINQSFVIENSFNLLGGINKNSSTGDFLGLYSIQQRNSQYGHPYFSYYATPKKGSLTIQPALNLLQSTFYINTSVNVGATDFPNIDYVLLVIQAVNGVAQFKVIWYYSTSWEATRPIVASYGTMNCKTN